MKNFIIVFFVCFLTGLNLLSQGSAGENSIFESRRIVIMPTAGVLGKGDFSLYSTAFTGGGLMAEIDASPFTNFMMGISFSGTNIIGEGDIQWQNIPGIHFRYRVLDETDDLPAILIGLNTQGIEKYINKDKRFQILSPGLFLTVSKNYRWILGIVAFHAGVSYSFEIPAKNRVPNLFLGMEHTIWKYFSLSGEYDFTFDEQTKEYMKKKGLLNMSLRWSMGKGLTLELQAIDLLRNINGTSGFRRSIALEYINHF